VYTACVHGDFKDNKLITKCPALPGVGFQHIARRRLGGALRGLTSAVETDAPHAQRSGGRILDGSILQAAAGQRYLRTIIAEEVEEGSGEEEHRRTTSRAYNLFRSKPRHRHARAPIPWVRQLDAQSAAGMNNTTGMPGGAESAGVTQSVEGGQFNGTHSADGGVPKHDFQYAPVHNRSHLLVVSSLRPPAKNIDHGKQGSLSSINSKHDGNFHQWNKATEFLRRKGLFDIDEVLQKYVRRERSACAATSLLLHYDNTTWAGSVVGAFATSLQALHESWTDGRCGIVTCYA
jgi:hypothetical protein